MTHQSFKALFHSCIHFLLSFMLVGMRLAAQDPTTKIELTPSIPSSYDNIAYKLSGVWRNGCAPQSPQISISPSTVLIETSNPGIICTEALTPWSITGSLGRLPAGDYNLIVKYSAPGTPSYEIGRKAISIISAQAPTEVIYPIVVNGSFADKLHYQTIFTILNATSQSMAATLQVYTNAGNAGGVFCAPVAPPPSRLTFSLKPNEHFLRFTSADLPFHNGWARLGWDGPAAIIASEEITLITAAPEPCQLVCDRPSTEKLSSTQMLAATPAREFRVPITINRNRQTALAVVNPSSKDPITIKVAILDALGEAAKLGVPDNFEFKISPLERISKFIWQMALERSILTVIIPTPESFQGSVILSSTSPFAVGALNIMFPEGKFVSVPALPTIP